MKDPAGRYQTAAEFDRSARQGKRDGLPEPTALSLSRSRKLSAPAPIAQGETDSTAAPPLSVQRRARAAPPAHSRQCRFRDPQPSMEPPEQPGIAAAPPSSDSVPETAAVVEVAATRSPSLASHQIPIPRCPPRRPHPLSSPLPLTLPCRRSSSSLAVPPARVWACCWWSSGCSSNDRAASNARHDARRLSA